MDILSKIYFFIVNDFPQIIFPIPEGIYRPGLHGEFASIALVWVIVFIASREILHILGGVVVDFVGYESRKFYKNLDYIVFILILVFILFQEFYLHTLLYKQSLYKSVMDTFFWGFWWGFWREEE
jgi:hypothetical protein